MNPYVALSLAILALLFAVAIWYGSVRPLTPLLTSGVIVDKAWLPARTIKRIQGGPRNEAWSQQEIKIPESYLFDLEVTGMPRMQFSLAAPAAKSYAVGQRVKIRYVERGIPPVWRRIQVTEMSPLDNDGH